MDAFKEMILNKLVIRLLYIAGAFSASHLVALASSGKVQAVLFNAGVQIKVLDPHRLDTYITGLLLIAGEFAFHFFHQKVILPQVAQESVTPTGVKP